VALAIFYDIRYVGITEEPYSKPKPNRVSAWMNIDWFTERAGRLLLVRVGVSVSVSQYDFD